LFDGAVIVQGFWKMTVWSQNGPWVTDCFILTERSQFVESFLPQCTQCERAAAKESEESALLFFNTLTILRGDLQRGCFVIFFAGPHCAKSCVFLKNAVHSADPQMFHLKPCQNTPSKKEQRMTADKTFSDLKQLHERHCLPCGHGMIAVFDTGHRSCSRSPWLGSKSQGGSSQP